MILKWLKMCGRALPQNCIEQTWTRRKRHLGQYLVYTGSERPLLQDEDHSGSRPYSFPGCFHMCSGMSPERIRNGPELISSEESRQAGIERLKSDFPSYWTPWITVVKQWVDQVGGGGGLKTLHVLR